jgi:hypothetical protein
MRCAAEPLCHMCLSWEHQCRQDSPLEEPPSRDTPSVAGGYGEFDSEAVNQAHAAGLPFAEGSVSASSSAAGPKSAAAQVAVGQLIPYGMQLISSSPCSSAAAPVAVGQLIPYVAAIRRAAAMTSMTYATVPKVYWQQPMTYAVAPTGAAAPTYDPVDHVGKAIAAAPPPLQVPVPGFVVPLVKPPPPHLVGKTPAVLAPGVVPKKNPPPPRPIRR